jgi:hypothetical protein
MLANGTVTTAKLGDASVSSTKIADQAITGPKIAPKTITTDHFNNKIVRDIAGQSDNIPNMLVRRNANGDFTAGKISADMFQGTMVGKLMIIHQVLL